MSTIYKYNNWIFSNITRDALLELINVKDLNLEEEDINYLSVDSIINILKEKNVIEIIQEENLTQEVKAVAEEQLKELILMLKWKKIDLWALNDECKLILVSDVLGDKEKQLTEVDYKNILARIISVNGIIESIKIQQILDDEGCIIVEKDN